MILELAISAALGAQCPEIAAKYGTKFSPVPSAALDAAEALHPSNVIRSFTRRAAVDSMRKSFMADPGIAKLEQQLPGFRDALLGRAPEAMDRLLDAQIPWLQQCMAEKFTSKMTVEDIKGAITYLSSEEGKTALQQATDQNIRLYLEKGPLTKEDVARIKHSRSRASGKTVPASAGRLARLATEVIESWQPDQMKAEEQMINALVESLATQMIEGQSP